VDDADRAIRFDAGPLAPATHYFYRFVRVDTSESSPTGAFNTPALPSDARPFRFIYTGDSNAAYQPFRILGFAADEQPDFWFWAGDTIYGDFPAGGLGVATDLTGYRAKYDQNRGDPFLRRLTETAPVWVQWDDHEVTNDYDGGDPEPGISPLQISD